MNENPYAAHTVHDARPANQPRRAPICAGLAVGVPPMSAIVAILLVNFLAPRGPQSMTVAALVGIGWITGAAAAFVGLTVAAVLRRERHLWLTLVAIASALVTIALVCVLA